MKLHIVFGSNRSGEAVWLMLHNRAVIQSSSASVSYKLQIAIAKPDLLQVCTYMSTN